MKKNLKMDYHMHSWKSTDARDSIAEMCEAALKAGLSEIAVTDHFEPTPGDRSYLPYDGKAIREELMLARSAFDRQLNIRMGIELGQPHRYREETTQMLARENYDFIIASAHKLENGMDMSELNYREILPKQAVELYLRELHGLVDGFTDFDVLGHLDLVKRYSHRTYGFRVSLMDSKETLEELFRKLISMGRGIEINTSGLRQGAGETLPGLDVLKLYRSLGGEILTIGSDAHKKEDVGEGIDFAQAMAVEAGFRYLTSFTNRTPSFYPIGGTTKKGGHLVRIA